MNISSGATTRSPRWRSAALVPVLVASALAVVGATAAPALATPVPGTPDLGPNVHVIDPSMSTSDIQAVVDGVAAAQVGNQFGTRRDAILFEPGTYGTAQDPLNFQVGYYTEVAGLGQNPGAVVINGTIDVYNQCDGTGNNCIALNNFWRSLSNLTIVATHLDAGCRTNTEFWAVSQASPMRRVQVNGATTLMDYCTAGPQYASGGFIADSSIEQATVVSGSQQQWLTRNSAIGGWSNGVWNQVFSGVEGAPAEAFGGQGTNQYTVVAATPASREKPYLYIDNGVWSVFVPDAATNSSGPTWSGGVNTPGRTIPLSQFYVATSADSTATLNAKVASGLNLLLTPGVYAGTAPINIKRAGTIVLGLGMATFASAAAGFSINVGDVAGVDIAGIIVDAGAQNSAALMRIGATVHGTLAGYGTYGPNSLQDVFFRIGGAQLGKATNSLIVSADNTILDDIWAWRADHGTGVGWTSNTAATGLVVNADNVTATGLFVEHYQGYEVIWRGENGKVVFFQNEMPYDVPNQAAWKSAGGNLGYAAFKVAQNVQTFQGSGMGSYSFFNQGVNIWATHAFETPAGPGIHFHDLLTIFLDPSAGKGGIRNVINNVGGKSAATNASAPVIVVDYPVVD